MLNIINTLKLSVLLTLTMILFGCNSMFVNYLPDKTNQARNQIDGPNNISLMAGSAIDIKGDWYGIDNNQKNCYFSFNDNGSYVYATYTDHDYNNIAEYEAGNYFLLGDSEIMFVSNYTSSLPDNLYFNMDNNRRKITFFNNPTQNTSIDYEIYNSEYYDIY